MHYDEYNHDSKKHNNKSHAHPDYKGRTTNNARYCTS